MKYILSFLLFLMTIFASPLRAQDNQEKVWLDSLVKSRPDSNRVNLLLNLSKYYLNSSPENAKIYGQKALDLSVTIKYNPGMALAYKNLGLSYYMVGDYQGALSNFGLALKTYGLLGDIQQQARLLNNFGSVYYDRGQDDSALDYYFKSYALAEQLDDKVRMATVLNGIGIVYLNKNATQGKALENFLKSLKLADEAGDKYVIGGASVNAGELYQKMNMQDSALYYFSISLNAYNNTVDMAYPLNDMGNVYEQKGDFRNAQNDHTRAYNIALTFDSKLDMAQSQLGLGRIFHSENQYRNAINAYTEALRTASSISSKKEMDSAYAGLASSNRMLKDFAKADMYQLMYSNLSDTLNNQVLSDKLTHLQTNFEIVQRENTINLLTKDKELQNLNLKRQNLIKNAFALGFLMIIVIASLIYRGYRNKVKTNQILDKQKVEIENLLQNILPGEVAQELQTTGHATPRYYKSVSVLFTDFKNFTSHADALTPQEVVSELNTCFIAFDDIVEKYHLEKIKTIGDSYMCAGGIPKTDEEHPQNIIRAGLDIVKFMKQRNASRIDLGLAPWDVRVGVHIGPVVAGVVGRKKYAYDIWGSTVNIASRMESNGEPGQVNISAETYNCIKDQFSCTHRGKIWAKSVGEIDMYFVDSESQSVFIPQERKETEIVLSISQQGVSPQNIGI
jgi:adenylate cyclase